MLELSDIQSSQEELEDYYAQLRAQHVTPAWIGGGISFEPQSKAVPYLWRWRDLRPQAMRAAELVGTQQAERRVLRLTNPELSGASASNTLVANIQIVMPGEIARAHRHSAAALFFFSSRRRHTRFDCDWSSDVCSSDLLAIVRGPDPIDESGGLPARR